MRWPPYQHVFFDCDSTLSTIEGIDVLARLAGKEADVASLTNEAMNGQIDLRDVYGKRLDLVNPSRQQIAAIRQAYKQNIVTDARELIAALQFLAHKLYIISGGLAEPVTEFGIFLGIPKENIRGVHVAYNKLSERWWQKDNHNRTEKYLDFTDGDLTATHGKAHVIRELLGNQKGRTLLVGDGSSDLRASEAVDLFVGFGGVIAREKVAAESPVFIHTPSLAPLLALIIGPAGLTRLLNSPHHMIAKKTIDLINTGAITFTNERLKRKFNNAYQAVYPRTD